MASPRTTLVVHRPSRYRDRAVRYRDRAVRYRDRAVRYRDRAVRYRVRVDGTDVHPGLLPNSQLEVELDAGFHAVAVAGRKDRWSMPSRLLLAAGDPATRGCSRHRRAGCSSAGSLR